MKQRVNIHAIEPKALNGIFQLENFIKESSLSRTHIHLMKVRASQINGCAFCINMHTIEAINDGESHQRLYLLDAWRESNLFSEEEQALLQLTEEVTRIHQGGVSDETYERIAGFFNENELAIILMAIVAINSWNRVAISTHMPLGED